MKSMTSNRRYNGLVAAGLIGLTSLNLGSAGIPSDIPPLLLQTSPIANAKNVPVDSPVIFTFTTPMAPTQSITWSPDVTAANFTYTWDAAATNLTAKYNMALPANATITWTLDPTAFMSQSGTPLFAFNLTGSFTTGSGSGGTTNLCNGGSTNTGSGVLLISKSVDYVQTSANPPAVDPDLGARFFAEVQSPATNPVMQATLLLPSGATKALTNLFGMFLMMDQFPTQETLDAAYQPGNYTVTIVRATGTAVLTLALLPTGVPPTPQMSNLAQLQNWDATADVMAQWLPFAGVTTADYLSFDLNDTHGTDFHAPDLCIPRPLANTLTSIVVPKNTFGAGETIDGSLTFQKNNSSNTNSVPGIPAYATYSKTTSFKATTSGGSVDGRPSIQNLVRLADGTVQFQVTGEVGKTLTALASNDLKTWTPISSGLSVTGALQVTDTQAASMPYRFYKGQAQ
jgi:hypothetical protein